MSLNVPTDNQFPAFQVLDWKGGDAEADMWLTEDQWSADRLKESERSSLQTFVTQFLAKKKVRTGSACESSSSSSSSSSTVASSEQNRQSPAKEDVEATARKKQKQT